MRQLLLVVVLVAASFLGGVFVNGPGLRWAQTQVLRTFGLGDGEIASVDLTATAAPASASSGSPVAKPATATAPAAPDLTLSLAAVDEPSEAGTSDRRGLSPARPDVKDAAAAAPLAKSPLSAASGAATPAGAQTAPLTRASLEQTSRAIGRPVPLRKSSSRDPELAQASSDSPLLVPRSSPAAGSPPASSLPSSPAQMSVMGGGDEWEGLERKMQSLGVSRFTIEAEPGGRIVFSCLIPLAGAQAVAQRFEAEGDDLIQVTRAALRRIALWQATAVPQR